MRAVDPIPPTSAAARPVSWRRFVLRALLRGALFGALFTTAVMILVGLGHLAAGYQWNQRPSSPIDWRSLGTPLARASLVVLFCALLASLLFGVAAVFSSKPRGGTSDVFADRQSGPARPYASRLRQFLRDDVQSAPADGPQPGPAPFAGVMPERPTRPKAASYIRAILWHIRRLLGNGAER